MTAATALVHGAWKRGDGTLRAGRVNIYSNAQVSAPGEGILLPQGLVYTGPLNTDENALSGDSFALAIPLADQPGVIPQNFTITVEVQPQGAEPATFRLSPRVDLGDNIDLALYVPETEPHNPLQGEPGPQGLPGPQGDPGAEGVLAPYVFDTPIGTWTIEHNLGRLPVVALYDAAGHPQVIDSVVTETRVVVTWPFPVAGKAILR